MSRILPLILLQDSHYSKVPDSRLMAKVRTSPGVVQHSVRRPRQLHNGIEGPALPFLTERIMAGPCGPSNGYVSSHCGCSLAEALPADSATAVRGVRKRKPSRYNEERRDVTPKVSQASTLLGWANRVSFWSVPFSSVTAVVVVVLTPFT